MDSMEDHDSMWFQGECLMAEYRYALRLGFERMPPLKDGMNAIGLRIRDRRRRRDCECMDGTAP